MRPAYFSCKKQQFQDLGITIKKKQLGEVEIAAEPDAWQMNALGFEMLDDKKARIVEQAKTFILNLMQNPDEELNKSFQWRFQKRWRWTTIHNSLQR